MKTDGFKYKIGFVGPSRIGKTSLIATMLREGQIDFSGTQITIRPADASTEERLLMHKNELNGSILAGQFNPGAVCGTQETSLFKIEIDSGVEGVKMQFEILDYPGGWLTSSESRPENNKIKNSSDIDNSYDDTENETPTQETWEYVKKYLKECNLLIIPVEASLIMESNLPKYIAAANRELMIASVEQIVIEWAKFRNNCEEASTLLLCPLKCESYFKDNGGKKDSSDKLYNKVINEYYRPIIESAKNEFSVGNLEIKYSPIDTIGCVEIINTHWHESPAKKKNLIFSADYRVRPPKKINTVGGREILKTILKQLFNIKKEVQEENVDKAHSSVKRSKDEIENRGFIKRFCDWFSGESKKLHEKLEKDQENYQKQKDILNKFERTLLKIAESKNGPRVRII